MCERNLNADISAYVTPPTKKTSVTFCSAVDELTDPVDGPATTVSQ